LLKLLSLFWRGDEIFRRKQTEKTPVDSATFGFVCWRVSVFISLHSINSRHKKGAEPTPSVFI